MCGGWVPALCSAARAAFFTLARRDSLAGRGHFVGGVAADGRESGKDWRSTATGAGPRSGFPSSGSLRSDARSSSGGEDILGQKGFRGAEAKKDAVSFAFLDVEVASQETKGRTSRYAKMDSVDFFGDFCLWVSLVWFFFLFPFLSSSTRFETN